MSTSPNENRSELPKQYDHLAAQRRWYQFWEQRGCFSSDPNPAKRPYTIAIPPPNVTGALHLGHALNNTLQDICIRRKRMQGFEALWIPGTDHAGIATQAVVERRLLQEEGLSRHQLGRQGLVDRIWQWKNEYEARILGQLKQMGCSCDWRRTRFTLDPICARAVRHTFFSLFKERLIYRGKRLVNWDTMLQTAVSDDEVFHETVDGHFWYINYPLIDPRPGEPAHVTVATTRPETMLGDTAVAVHPDPAGALERAERDLRAKIDDAPAKERPELEDLLEQLRRRRDEMLPLLVKLRDMARRGAMALLPLQNRPIPLIEDIWAKPELGTGCVKITPAHDPNDYEVGKRHGLPMPSILNPDGTLRDEAGPYRGKTIAEARAQVVADLEALGLLAKVEDRKIELAHSDRSKTPIEPLLTDQWFVKMDHLAQTAIDAVVDGRVKIIPSRYAKGYLDWLGEKRDWPISRQLWWGHQIPVWSAAAADRNALSDALALLAELDRRFPRLMKHQVEEPERTGEGAAPGGAVVHACLLEDQPELIAALESAGFVRSPDVLDTWFSSALWPHSTLGWPEQTPELRYYYPTSALVTSRDIITLWVARMVLAGLHNVGEVPFAEVYIHPKILDAYGEGMSKSKGNGVDPIDVIEKFGADALRFGLAYLTTETQDIRMPVEFECPHCEKLVEQTRENRILPRIKCPHCGKAFSTQWAKKPADVALPRGAVVSERFELARNFCNKLWNASRFVMMNLEDYRPAAMSSEELRVEDRWVLSRLFTVTEVVSSAFDEYRFADAARALYDFAWDEFCSFYVEMVKTRLQNEAERPVAQRVLTHALDVLLRLLHPVAPFVTEEVWQRLAAIAPVRGLDDPRPAAESIMIAPWPVARKEDRDAQIEALFARFQEVLRGVRDIRARQNVPPRTTVRFSIRTDAELAEALRPMAPYFVSMAGAELTEIGPQTTAPPLCAGIALPAMEVFVNLAGVIDVEAECARKRKELADLEKFIAAKRNKLQNQSFIERAPAEVVQKERDSLNELAAARDAAVRALEQLIAAAKT